MQQATDNAWMTQFLNQEPNLLQMLGLFPPVQVRHELLKYAPGKRCVLAYHLRGNGQRPFQHAPSATNQDRLPTALIAKMYRGARGADIFSSMQQLWKNGGQQMMARPYQYIPPLSLILQERVPGKPLATMLKSDSLIPALETAADNLVHLHNTPVIGLSTRQTMASHLIKYCRPHPEHIAKDLAARHPHLSNRIYEILDAINQPDLLENEPLKTVHNDLNLAHIYWEQDYAYFIDFDGLCLSHAALDLATLRIALRVYLGQYGMELGDHFLTMYGVRGQVPSPAVLSLYESFVYLRRATICYRKRITNGWMQEFKTLLDMELKFRNIAFKINS